MLTISCFIICGLAALAGGFIDAISGGGGLLSIPALLLTGVPPHFALGTNKVAACLGTAISLFNFSRHGLVCWKMAGWGIGFSIVGSWLGSLFALYLDSALLGKILVILLPIAMLAILLPHKKGEITPPAIDGVRFWIGIPIVCAALGWYDGFFGPGAGSFLILCLHWFLKMDLITASATAKAFNLASNLSAAISFVWHGAILWPLALVMAACFMTGNWLGSLLAIKSGSKVVQKFLIVSLLILLNTLIWQYFIAS